jgi:hypothetical protein
MMKVLNAQKIASRALPRCLGMIQLPRLNHLHLLNPFMMIVNMVVIGTEATEHMQSMLVTTIRVDLGQHGNLNMLPGKVIQHGTRKLMHPIHRSGRLGEMITPQQ